MLLRVIFILILISISSAALYAKEIPIIVISAGKSTQSYSTVGSDIEVIDCGDSSFTMKLDITNFLVIA